MIVKIRNRGIGGKIKRRPDGWAVPRSSAGRRRRDGPRGPSPRRNPTPALRPVDRRDAGPMAGRSRGRNPPARRRPVDRLGDAGPVVIGWATPARWLRGPVDRLGDAGPWSIGATPARWLRGPSPGRNPTPALRPVDRRDARAMAGRSRGHRLGDAGPMAGRSRGRNPPARRRPADRRGDAGAMAGRSRGHRLGNAGAMAARSLSRSKPDAGPPARGSARRRRDGWAVPRSQPSGPWIGGATPARRRPVDRRGDAGAMAAAPVVIGWAVPWSQPSPRSQPSGPVVIGPTPAANSSTIVSIITPPATGGNGKSASSRPIGRHASARRQNR